MANMKLRCILPAAMQQKGIYYYTTYENHQITAVDMHRENLDGETLVHYPVVKGEHILWQN